MLKMRARTIRFLALGLVLALLHSGTAGAVETVTAGAVGSAMLSRCIDLRWARRAKGSRIVSFTPLGESALREQFDLPTPRSAHV